MINYDRWYENRENSSANRYLRFPTQYFSGANIAIYFGDILIDEINSIEFTVTERVTPIFGYASYTADAISHGQRFVQGRFGINFTEPFYIKKALQRIEESNNKNIDKKGNSYFNAELLAVDNESMSVEDLIKQGEKYGYPTVAQHYQAAIWGQEGANTSVLNRHNDSLFVNHDKNDFLLNNGFDIIITYGNIADPMRESLLPGAVKSINGVHITACQQVINTADEPVMEIYTFIAKDIDGIDY
jgi:hypothetical protein